jgi:diguanylate cyclase (GGDEF)-like protein/PAS domain S-box-containing protein
MLFPAARGAGVRRYRPHILVLCILAAALLTGLNTTLQNALTDTRFRWAPRPASGDIVLVAIDAASIDAIGVWPWPRQLHATLIDQLERAGATDVVFDIDFSSPSNPDADRAFAEALERAGGSIVLPVFRQSASRQKDAAIHVNRPLPQFDAHAWSAVVNVRVDPDGLVRRYSFGETIDGAFLPSVGALLAGKYESKDEPLRIDFSIQAATLPVVSFADLLRGDPAAVRKVAGRKVIVGSTAIELGDQFSVPNGHVLPGPQVQMLAAESILQNRVMRSTSDVVTYGGIVVVMLLSFVLWRRGSVGVRALALLALAAAAELAGTLLQARAAIVLDTSLWHIALAAYLAVMAIEEIDFRGLLGGIAESRFQRIAMSLGDGLVCLDHNGLITVWNPGAEAIFGFVAADMIGQTLDRICDAGRGDAAFSILTLPFGTTAGAEVMELVGRRKSGEAFSLEASFSRWQGVDGFQYGAVMRDISVRKREAERIRYLAEHDTLTGLPNRNSLYADLRRRIAAATINSDQVALMVLDLDKFKQINDTMGHACGDELLCSVARRLTDVVAGAGLVARLSGDEFAIVISGPDADEGAANLCEQVSLALAATALPAGGREIFTNASIGAAVYPEFGSTADELLGNADLALYRAKAAGRGHYMFFERPIRDELEARLLLETQLGQAVERDELELFFQPQFNLRDRTLAGAEALIRWRKPGAGLVPPSQFMPLVNASPISVHIAQWVLETACRQGRAWEQQGHRVRLGVNLSPSQLQSGDLASTVRQVLKDTGLAPALLELEVTEDILLEDDEAALAIFRRIQDLGVHIAFDDFGTGYASMTYLKKFRLDRLKIDQSFVRDLRTDSNDAAIVGCTVSLGKLLGLSIIAEGIEDAETADFLAGMGCEEGQGYWFGPPMPAAEFEQRFLAKRAAEPAATAA